jgi:GNAT superfamily N-acetyltransferase
MADRLVKLYTLPDLGSSIETLGDKGIKIRRAMAFEKFQIVAWVQKTFGLSWASECDVAFSNHPISCYIATARNSVAAFACHDSTCKNFFGPLGVAEKFQRRGIGTALLLRCLYAMAENGYAYAIIGDSDKAAKFYSSIIETIKIDGSSPGIYSNRLGAV